MKFSVAALLMVSFALTATLTEAIIGKAVVGGALLGAGALAGGALLGGGLLATSGLTARSYGYHAHPTPVYYGSPIASYAGGYPAYGYRSYGYPAYGYRSYGYPGYYWK